MPALTRQPTNINFLSQLNFRFLLKRAPNVTFYTSRVEMPTISLEQARYPTQLQDIPLPGDRFRLGDLSITFKVDEDLRNYLEIFDWIEALARPRSYDQYKALSDNDKGRTTAATGTGVLSDATMMALTSAKNPNIECQFLDIWPTSLTDLSFSAEDPDVEYVIARATFKLRHFQFTRLG